MNKPTILLAPAMYHDFVEGRQIQCSSDLELHSGEHVVVYKNTLAASTSVPVPHSNQQSDSIGVEGIVTIVDQHGAALEITINKI